MNNEQSKLTILLELKDQVLPGLERARNLLHNMRNEASAVLRGLQLLREEFKKGVLIAGIAFTSAGTQAPGLFAVGGGVPNETGAGLPERDESYGLPRAIGLSPAGPLDGASPAPTLGLTPASQSWTELQTIAPVVASLRSNGSEGVGGSEPVTLFKGLEPAGGAQKAADAAQNGWPIKPSVLGSKARFVGEENLSRQLDRLDSQTANIIGVVSQLTERREKTKGTAESLTGFIQDRKSLGTNAREAGASLDRSTPPVISIGKESESAGTKAGGLEGILGLIGGMSSLKLPVTLGLVGEGLELITSIREQEKRFDQNSDPLTQHARGAPFREDIASLRSGDYEPGKVDVAQLKVLIPKRKEVLVKRWFQSPPTIPWGDEKNDQRAYAVINEAEKIGFIPNKESRFKLGQNVWEQRLGDEFTQVLDPDKRPRWASFVPLPSRYRNPAGPIGRDLNAVDPQTPTRWWSGMPEFHSPGMVAGFIEYLDKQRDENRISVAAYRQVHQTLGITDKDPYGKAIEIVRQRRMKDQLGQFQVVQGLSEKASTTAATFDAVGLSAARLQGRFDNVKPELIAITKPNTNTDANISPTTRTTTTKRRKAAGGRVLHGVSDIGGERGRELFTPDQGGVTSNHELAKLRSQPVAPATVTMPLPVARAIVRSDKLAEIRGQGAVTHHHHYNRPINVAVNVPRGRATEDPEVLADYIERALTNRIARYRERA